ncbi:LytR/AlgR family response regulator transcription factor [Pontibacillus marinus]|uniref:Uncharacterized protein n=1 Tax=Pontibacillus marinus BH030004 = DSM 16465 TaxID=1385511 RepID=A0A0A5FXL7_9BACI|nr:LytTR family DNA-binding domain-containing protein [Pontibacillus marinus]KGX83550.1 hypothetical protein N783_02755 [Pontibacillus marinus BH030004 = DSM 16465]
MTYRILIADDQEASRKLLKQMISKVAADSFSVIDEAVDGVDLVEKVIQHQPDLVMCDIEMPRKRGIDAIRECVQTMPSLAYIFTTAHDKFAVEAFDLHALDYVMKPIQISRLHLALDRAKKTLDQKQTEESENQKATHRIPIRFNRSLYYVQVEDILFIEKRDRKSVIHTAYQSYSSTETLEYFLDFLDDSFVQSHRSFIIHLTHISHIQTSGKSYLVYFHDYETPAQISKQNIQRIHELMSHFQT